MQTGDLFATDLPAREPLADGVTLLRRFAGTSVLLPLIEAVAAGAPFRHMSTRGGRAMSVAMTNCGAYGWVSDSRGYRYEPLDPDSKKPWPEMPEQFRTLAVSAAAAGGFDGYAPDVCLVNRYAPGTRLGVHQDLDEANFSHPIVSVSLGLPATFLLHGDSRKTKARPVPLEDGSVMVMGGPGRRAFHGVRPVADGKHPLTGPFRFNLTFRRAR